MKFSKKAKYHEQFPNRGVWDVLHPSYLTIGGSGVVGNFGAESPMSEIHAPSWPKDIRAADISTGEGAVAGAATTYGGSGIA